MKSSFKCPICKRNLTTVDLDDGTTEVSCEICDYYQLHYKFDLGD